MRSTLTAFVPALFALLLVSTASAQEKFSKKQVIGTWTLVSVVNTLPDGSKFDPNGGRGTGVLMLDSGGRFSCISSVPTFRITRRTIG
ncbi:MAG TPA: hypothetical protein VL966_09225 [Alphaproteobacteria bacterium]|nr:hypothetical protein [Alphaproteobacteria bacterium]